MNNQQSNEEYLAPIYMWAFGDEVDIPKDLQHEIKELRQLIDWCDLKPRDSDNQERYVLRLMKAVYWLRWVHENPDKRHNDKARIVRLRRLISTLTPLDRLDALCLSAYSDHSDIVEQFKEACVAEYELLCRPFQMLILETLADIYPFLTICRLSMSKGSKFMELAGEIDRYVTGRNLKNPAESMADYAKKYGFDIEKYRVLESYLNR